MKIDNWYIVTLWSDGSLKEYADVPNDVAQPIDDWLSEKENRLE